MHWLLREFQRNRVQKRVCIPLRTPRQYCRNCRQYCLGSCSGNTDPFLLHVVSARETQQRAGARPRLITRTTTQKESGTEQRPVPPR